MPNGKGEIGIHEALEKQILVRYPAYDRKHHLRLIIDNLNSNTIQIFFESGLQA